MAMMISVGDLEPAFRNAMNNLLINHEVDTVGKMCRVWKEVYDCYLLHDSDLVWDVVGFKDEKQATLFVLKWT